MIAVSSPKIGISRSRVDILVLILTYRAFLDITYALWISPYMSYMRLELVFRSVWVVALSYFLVIVTGTIIPLKSSPCKFVVGIIYIVSYVPVTTLFAWGGFRKDDIFCRKRRKDWDSRPPVGFKKPKNTTVSNAYYHPI